MAESPHSPRQELAATKSSTLLLTREVIAHIATPSLYLEAMSEAFQRLAAGVLTLPPVAHLPALDGAFHIKAAVSVASPRRAAVKINGNFPHNAQRHGLPAIQGFIALLDAERGNVLALMDSIEITARRTAATSALAARYLACKHARRLALIGCGAQAHCHFDALAELFPLESIALFDTLPGRADELAQRVAAKQLTADVQSSAAACARNADIVVTSTPSRVALLDAHDVSAGCFIAAVGADSAGKQELTPQLLRRARVVPDVLAQALRMGDLQHAIAAGIMTPGDIHGELADLVAGRVPGRSSDEELFVFDSTGTAVADLAAAEMVYKLACNDPAAWRRRLNA